MLEILVEVVVFFGPPLMMDTSLMKGANRFQGMDMQKLFESHPKYLNHITTDAFTIGTLKGVDLKSN